MRRGLSPHADAVRRQQIAHELNRGRRLLDSAFRADVKQQLVPKEGFDGGEYSLCVLLALDEDAEIVHIAHIVVYFQRALDELIQLVQKQVGRFLARQVADGHTHIIEPPPSRAIVRLHPRRQAERHVRVIDDRPHKPAKPDIIRNLVVGVQHFSVFNPVKVFADVALDKLPFVRVRFPANEL